MNPASARSLVGDLAIVSWKPPISSQPNDVAEGLGAEGAMTLSGGDGGG